MIDFIAYTLSGAAIGLVIGMTGVGGGSFMTPILLAFGFAPAIAIGTDLLYAAITKAGGVITHTKQKTIDWKIVKILASGSIPSCLVTVFILKRLQSQEFEYSQIMTTMLGVMLVITGMVLLFRSLLLKEREIIADSSSTFGSFERRHVIGLTYFMGLLLGILVTLSSVGAGAFGAAVLMTLYPRIPMIRIIGTDLAHAIPLTAISGLGHMALGNVDFTLLLSLILGSLPAIWLGTKLANVIPERILQPFMASILLLLGLKYIFF